MNNKFSSPEKYLSNDHAPIAFQQYIYIGLYGFF